MDHKTILIVLSCAFLGCTPAAVSSKPEKVVAAKEPQSDEAAESKNSRTIVKITSAAKERLESVLTSRPNSYIRVGVKYGGPTGFMYDLRVLSVDESPISEDDSVDSTNGFRLIVDSKSALYLEGATIDWETRADGQAGFKFDNPNAVSK